MRILLSGYYGRGNLGDDVLLAVTHAFVRERHPEATIYVGSTGVACDYVSALVGEKTHVVRGPEPIAFDVSVSGGGGVFFDLERGAYPYLALNAAARRLGGRTASRALDAYRTLRGSRVPVVKHRVGLGLGVGEYTASSRRLFTQLATLASFDSLVVRDRESLERAHALVPELSVEVATDLAFARRHWLPRVPRGERVPGRVGFVVRDWPFDGPSYLEAMLAAAERLRARGHDVAIFSFDADADRAVLDRLPRDARIWDPRANADFGPTLSALGACDVVVSARAHGAILAACMDVPTLCVPIERKLELVAGMLPRSSSALPKGLTADEIVARTIAILRDADAKRAAAEEDAATNERLLEGVLARTRLRP